MPICGRFRVMDVRRCDAARRWVWVVLESMDEPGVDATAAVAMMVTNPELADRFAQGQRFELELREI
jgi:hypothetical protein